MFSITSFISVKDRKLFKATILLRLFINIGAFGSVFINNAMSMFYSSAYAGGYSSPIFRQGVHIEILKVNHILKIQMFAPRRQCYSESYNCFFS